MAQLNRNWVKSRSYYRRRDRQYGNPRYRPPPTWGQFYLSRIAKAITVRPPEYKYIQLLGPAGLLSSCWITFYKDPEMKGEQYSIPLRFGGGPGAGFEILIPDYSKDTGEYRPGTLGHMNGMNHPDTRVGLDVDFNELWKFATLHKEGEL